MLSQHLWCKRCYKVLVCRELPVNVPSPPLLLHRIEFFFEFTTETGRPRILIDCSNSNWLWRQTLMISVTWRCLSNRKTERTWSHSFLLGDFAGTACCSQFGVSESTIFVEAPNSSTESFLYHSTIMEPKMLPLKLSCMDFPRIRVHLLLFTEYAIVKVIP